MQHSKKYFARLVSDICRDWQLYLLLSGLIVWYLLFVYKPIYGLQIAFKDYNIVKGIQESPWVGLAHFKEFIEGPYFWSRIRNTLLISLYSLLFQFPAPIILALLFNEVGSLRFKKFAQTITYLPHFISVVVVAGLVTNFLSPSSGVINAIIEKLGGERVFFLSKKEYFRTIFILMGIWKETGFGSIIFLAALSGVDTQLYEAADIDGASKLSRIWHVTLPGIAPTIIIMLIMRIGNILNVSYESIILLYQPITYETADVLSSYMYRTGLSEGRYDLAAAIGFFQSAIGFLLVVMANWISKRVTETSLW